MSAHILQGSLLNPKTPFKGSRKHLMEALNGSLESLIDILEGPGGENCWSLSVYRGFLGWFNIYRICIGFGAGVLSESFGRKFWFLLLILH